MSYILFYITFRVSVGSIYFSFIVCIHLNLNINGAPLIDLKLASPVRLTFQLNVFHHLLHCSFHIRIAFFLVCISSIALTIFSRGMPLPSLESSLKTSRVVLPLIVVLPKTIPGFCLLRFKHCSW